MQVAQHHPQATVARADSGDEQSVIDTGTAYGIDVHVGGAVEFWFRRGGFDMEVVEL